MKYLFIFLIACIPAVSAAKTFQNSYITFQMPDTWDCQQEGTTWNCRSTLADEKRSALVIMAAKEVGPEDQLASYLAHLKKPKTLKAPNGLAMTSQVLSAEEKNYGGQHWIESLHLSSEVPGFHTLYLATVKDRLAILVTFSARRDGSAKFNPLFRQMINSLRITATQQLLMGSGAGNNTQAMGLPIQAASAQRAEGATEGATAVRNSSLFRWVYIFGGLLFVILMAAIYILKREK